MKLEDLYRDVVSLLREERIDYDSIYSMDIIHAINDSIALQRRNQVRAGVFSPFITQKTIYFNIADRNLPYLNEAKLDMRPIPEIDIVDVVVTAYVMKTDNDLVSMKQWVVGDTATHNTHLYLAVTSGQKQDPENYTFDSSELQFPVKGELCKTGELLYYPDTKNVKRVNQDFIFDEEPEDVTEVFWKKKGSAGVDASVLPYNEKRDLKVLSNSITINKKTLYASSDVGKVYLEYVPAWEPVEDLDEDIDLPISILQIVKKEVFQELAPKLRTSQKQTKNE